MMDWYIVKTNWDSTEQRFPGYLGLGGDVWPLDNRRAEPSCEAIHSKLMNNRAYVALGGHEELVCTDLSLAQAYADVARTVLKARVLLLRVGLAASGDDSWHGIDIGTPSGGFSLVETNVINRGRGERLNQWGLFQSVSQMRDFLEKHEGEIEDGDFATVRLQVV